MPTEEWVSILRDSQVRDSLSPEGVLQGVPVVEPQEWKEAHVSNAKYGFLLIPVRDENGKSIPSLFTNEVKEGSVWDVVKAQGSSPSIPLGTVVRESANRFRTVINGETAYGTSLAMAARYHAESAKIRINKEGTLDMDKVSETPALNGNLSLTQVAKQAAEKVMSDRKKREKDVESGRAMEFDALFTRILAGMGPVTEDTDPVADAATTITLNAD